MLNTSNNPSFLVTQKGFQMELYRRNKNLKHCVNFLGIFTFLIIAGIVAAGIVKNYSELSMKGWLIKGFTFSLYLFFTWWIIHSIQTKGGFSYMKLDVLEITNEEIILRSNWDPSAQETFTKTSIKNINLAYCNVSVNGSPFSLKIRIKLNSGKFREIEINSTNTDLGPTGIGGLTQTVASILATFQYPLNKVYVQLNARRWFLMLSYGLALGLFYITIMAFITM